MKRMRAFLAWLKGERTHPTYLDRGGRVQLRLPRHERRRIRFGR